MKQNISFIFFLVIYQKYNPVRENCRVKVIAPDHSNISFEQNSWEELFDVLDKMYPNIDYQIPDEIEVIRYDKHFNLLQ